MIRDYKKNLDNAIIDFIANTDKTLNDIISHVFELIMSAEQFEYVHSKRPFFLITLEDPDFSVKNCTDKLGKFIDTWGKKYKSFRHTNWDGL